MARQRSSSPRSRSKPTPSVRAKRAESARKTPARRDKRAAARKPAGKAASKAHRWVYAFGGGKAAKKVVIVPGRLVNVVV